MPELKDRDNGKLTLPPALESECFPSSSNRLFEIGDVEDLISVLRESATLESGVDDAMAAKLLF